MKIIGTTTTGVNGGVGVLLLELKIEVSKWLGDDVFELGWSKKLPFGGSISPSNIFCPSLQVSKYDSYSTRSSGSVIRTSGCRSDPLGSFCSSKCYFGVSVVPSSNDLSVACTDSSRKV